MVWLSPRIVALAQVAAGEITGVVKDQAGAAVPGATITVTDVATNLQRVVVSTGDGVYTAASLAPGEYRLDVELAGFKPMRREGIRLATGEKARIDFDLSGRRRAEQVTVVGDAPIVRAETASLGTVVENEQVVQLPLNGRLFIMLAGLAPGVALPPNSVLPRINGGRPRTNEYLFDGISVLQPEPGQVAYYPIVDAIQEFKIESNSPPAEFGRFNGGVVNLTTKSGSNAFHGNVFEFFRNEHLNARNYFQASNPVKPDYRRNQYGGMFGGPLVKDRTFFFVDYQGQRQSIGRTVTSNVPTCSAPGRLHGSDRRPRAGHLRSGDDGRDHAQQFPNNTIPTSAMDPVALSLLAALPAADRAATANNYSRTANEIDDQDQGDVRIDHKFATDRDQAFGRLTYFRDHADTGDAVSGRQRRHSRRQRGVGPQDTHGVGVCLELSTHLLGQPAERSAHRRYAASRPAERGAVVVAGGRRAQHSRHPVECAVSQHDADLRAERLPAARLAEQHRLGLQHQRHGGRRFAHLAEGPPHREDGARLALGAAQRDPAAMADRLVRLQHRRQRSAGRREHRQRRSRASCSDRCRPSRSISSRRRFRNARTFRSTSSRTTGRSPTASTINPGLRYTLNFPSTEINGQTAVFNLETQQLEYPGTEPVRPLKKNNFGPRLGAVYRVTDKTIVSSGYGMVWIEMAGITTPFTTPKFPFLQDVSQRTLDNITPAFVLAKGPTVTPIGPTPTAGLGQGVFAVDGTLGSGYAQQWNVVGAARADDEHGRRGLLPRIEDYPRRNPGQQHQSVDGQLSSRSALLDGVPNPYFGIIPRSSSIGDPTITRAQLMKPYPEYTAVSFYRNNVGTTNYQGLALSVRQRMSRGLTYSAAYTRSKLTDIASSVFDASILTGPLTNYPVADSHNLERDRDYSTGDIPHFFAASVVWDLPMGEGGQQPRGVVGALVNDWTVACS